MSGCKKTIFPICLFLLSLTSCATLDNLIYGDNGEETAEEKAIIYPYDAYVMYKNLTLIKVTFLNRTRLRISYVNDTVNGLYKYELVDTLYSWKRGYADMQLCGVQLKALRLRDNYEEWIEICTKGNFAKVISNPKDYFSEPCRNRYVMKTFFERHVTEESLAGESDFFYNAIPTIKFINWERDAKYERERKKEHLKYTRRW